MKVGSFRTHKGQDGGASRGTTLHEIVASHAVSNPYSNGASMYDSVTTPNCAGRKDVTQVTMNKLSSAAKPSLEMG